MSNDSAEQWLTIREAADKAGVAKSTVTRKRSGGDFPRAQLVEGVWKIPVGDLLEAGLLDQVQGSGAGGSDKGSETGASSAEIASLQLKAVQLEGALGVAKAERDRWQAVAEERQEVINALRMTVRALEPGSNEGDVKSESVKEVPDSVPSSPAKRGLLSRLFG